MQALLLAVKTTHVARTLLTLAFAQLSYQLSGKPRPLSGLLWPFWALVSGIPPLLVLVTLLLVFITATYILLKHKPALLVRCWLLRVRLRTGSSSSTQCQVLLPAQEAQMARSLLKESHLKLSFVEKLVPGLQRAIETSLQWVRLLKSLADCVALYLVVIAVSCMYAREVSDPVGP